ncbi:MAG: hypothetical protein GTN99_02080, partial [Candidatus Dadabacteria bacterium]|nr:hypothetical protein [Candidatus Dadabacteria bacterium]NIT13056.1 hypothetical protein [Candidatus Dadabacteria bacterium]
MIFYNKSVLFIITLLTLSLFTIGGCDIEFGTGDDNSGSSDPESIEGTVINLIPSADIEGLLVEVTDPDNQLNISSDVTSSNGFFNVTGRFIGIPTVEFFDQSDESLGLINVTVYDDSRIQLGNIRLENGVVVLDDPTIITFEGTVA